MKAYVGVTDGDWFELLSQQPELDEVNFWQPGSNCRFGEKHDEYLSLCRHLEEAAGEVERKHGTRPLTEKDGPASLTVFGLPLPVPRALRRPARGPLHTVAMLRLVEAVSVDLAGVLRASLGVSDPRVIADLGLLR